MSFDPNRSVLDIYQIKGEGDYSSCKRRELLVKGL